MFTTIITHAVTVWRIVKIIRSYYYKFRPVLVELVEDTETTDVDDKILAAVDKIFNYE